MAMINSKEELEFLMRVKQNKKDARWRYGFAKVKFLDDGGNKKLKEFIKG